MKTIEELGISPTPWKVCDERSLNGDVIGIECADKFANLVAGDLILKEADATIMSAAPDMYVALRELINAVLNGDPCHDAIQHGKAALAKACGEGGAK